MVNLVISGQDDFLDTKINFLSHKRLADEFKKEKSSFKIVIVCGMWLTGFDAPSLDTMYLNRLITGPTLIQTISRVNRSHGYKKAGLVVCYVPIKKALERAKDELSKMGGAGGICDLGTLFEELKEKIKELDIYFEKYSGWDLRTFLRGGEREKWLFVSGVVEWLEKQTFKPRVWDLLKEINKKYQRCKSYDPPRYEDLLFKDKLLLFEAIWMYFIRSTQREKIKGREIDELMKKAFSAYVAKGEESYEIFDLSLGKYWVNNEDNSAKSYQEKNEEDYKLLSGENKNLLESNSWLKERGERGILLWKRLKFLVEQYNSSWDEQEKMKIKEKIQELKEKEIDPFSKEEGERIKEESFIDFVRDNALKRVKEKYKFDYSTEDMTNLSRDIKSTADEYTQYRDWSKKTNLKSKLKLSWKDLLNQRNWATEDTMNTFDRATAVHDTLDQLLYIFKNYFADDQKDTQE